MGILDIFKGNSKELKDLANEIHKKFHITCDVLKKTKKKEKEEIIEKLNLNGVSLDKNNTNLREIHLDIGNAWVFSIIRNEDNSMTDFKKYEFHIMGIRDYQGLNLDFVWQDMKRKIEVVDLTQLWGTMSNSLNQQRLDQMKVGKHANKLFELIKSKGKFDY